jgi:hypothetical protein
MITEELKCFVFFGWYSFFNRRIKSNISYIIFCMNACDYTFTQFETNRKKV